MPGKVMSTSTNGGLTESTHGPLKLLAEYDSLSLQEPGPISMLSWRLEAALRDSTVSHQLHSSAVSKEISNSKKDLVSLLQAFI